MPNSEKRPLEYIELEGYKSIKKLPKFPLNPGLNVLIGANGSGKTNFIRFFELLGNMMDKNKGLQNYLNLYGGADAFLNRGISVTQGLRAHLWFGFGEYRFTLSSAANRTMFFSDEAITAYGQSQHGRQTFTRNASGHTESQFQYGVHHMFVEDYIINTIHDWAVHHFQDTRWNSPMMDYCNIIDNERLHGDASNISAVLMRIKNEKPEYYERIVKTVRLAAPFFGDFVLKETSRGKTSLIWKERYGDKPFFPYQLSDGTIRFICLATLLLQPSLPSTVIIDEPELGLHPYAIRLLAALLQEAATRTQIVVSTQSSALVDEFTPEDLIVVDRKDGETTLNRFNSQELEAWLEDYSLGELWDKNVLGGRPQP